MIKNGGGGGLKPLPLLWIHHWSVVSNNHHDRINASYCSSPIVSHRSRDPCSSCMHCVVLIVANYLYRLSKCKGPDSCLKLSAFRNKRSWLEHDVYQFEICCFYLFCTKIYALGKGALAIRRIFSLVDMITKPKFSNCPNIFKIGLFR